LQKSTDQKAKTYKGKRKTASIISLTIITAKKRKERMWVLLKKQQQLLERRFCKVLSFVEVVSFSFFLSEIFSQLSGCWQQQQCRD
jgi:glycerol-3-phosphate O-acyltransferase